MAACACATVWDMTKSTGAVRLAGLATSGVLLGVAGIHAAWAAGSTWPESSREALTDLVVGTPETFPGPLPTLAVTGLTAAASVLVGERALRARPHRYEAASRLGTGTVAAVLLARGFIGLLPAATAARTQRFAYWNARLYNPLCIALGLGAAAVTRSR